VSIYSTWLHIDDDNHEPGTCDRWTRRPEGGPRSSPEAFTLEDEAWWDFDASKPCTCSPEDKAPYVYQGSHVNPSEDDTRGGYVMASAIPDHCHPDARGNIDDSGELVDYLRLSVGEDPSTYHGMLSGQADVVLDRAQVQRLRDTLDKWLNAEVRW